MIVPEPAAMDLSPRLLILGDLHCKVLRPGLEECGFLSVECAANNTLHNTGTCSVHHSVKRERRQNKRAHTRKRKKTWTGLAQDGREDTRKQTRTLIFLAFSPLPTSCSSLLRTIAPPMLCFFPCEEEERREEERREEERGEGGGRKGGREERGEGGG
eukprot:3939897-Rhodomonas_salina.1